jgi:hypothetical protein
MSKPNDARAPLRAVVAVMLLAPVLAWPVVSTIEGEAPESPAGATAGGLPAAVTAPAVRPGGATYSPLPVPARAGGSYQIRCWQHGRLLFEENHVGLPDTARYALRISGHDTQGRPLYVADTQHATCLIRRAVDDRSWPR